MNNEIKNILICGLGAIGGYYASVFAQNNYSLKILTDKTRYERYSKTPRIINGKTYNFDYALPDDTGYTADLIIIATKSNGLDDAINNIKNFVGENTVILSFLNGITSEKKIIERYGDKVLYSYLLGHTFFRKGNEITHDGKANVIFGHPNNKDERIKKVKYLFEHTNIGHIISDNIITSQWQKFCFNCCVNQISAITRMTFGEIKNSPKCLQLIQHICDEITLVGEKEGITDGDFYNTTLKSLDLMIPEGKTSMLQDIEAGNKPEVDLFGETITALGEKYDIPIVYNRVISEILEAF